MKNFCIAELFHFVFSFTTIESKALFIFCFDTQQEKVIPPKSSSVCITLLSNRYFKWSVLEGNWAMACATKHR